MILRRHHSDNSNRSRFLALALLLGLTLAAAPAGATTFTFAFTNADLLNTIDSLPSFMGGACGVTGEYTSECGIISVALQPDLDNYTLESKAGINPYPWTGSLLDSADEWSSMGLTGLGYFWGDNIYNPSSPYVTFATRDGSVKNQNFSALIGNAWYLKGTSPLSTSASFGLKITTDDAGILGDGSNVGWTVTLGVVNLDRGTSCPYPLLDAKINYVTLSTPGDSETPEPSTAFMAAGGALALAAVQYARKRARGKIA